VDVVRERGAGQLLAAAIWFFLGVFIDTGFLVLQ